MSGGMIRKEQVRNSARMYAASPVSQSYDVQWTAVTTNPAIGDGTLTGRYVLRGNMCLVMICMVAGASTTFGSGTWVFSLPFAAENNGFNYHGVAHCRDAGVASYGRLAQILAGDSSVYNMFTLSDNNNVTALTSTVPFTWGANDNLTIQIEYEIA